MKRFWLTLCALALAACADSAPGGATVAVATNFKTTAEVLETAFEADRDFEITLVAGSTGKLYAQIEAGAPYDVFLAADEERPALLVKAGETGTPFTYAVGQLVLWRKGGPAPGPDDLTAPETLRIALANPDLAPYGRAAMEILAALGLADATKDKRVLGENVGQAFAFVQTGNAQLGFVARAQILSLPVERRGSFWTVPGDLHDPIRQDAMLLKRGAANPAARAFIDYLKSEDAAAIIRASGYDTP